MKAKIEYRVTQYRSAHVDVDDDDFLKWINAGGGDYGSLDEVRGEPGENLNELLVEYIEEAGHITYLRPQETGDDLVEIDHAKEDDD